VARCLQKFGEFGFRLGDLVVIMDPNGPAILILIDITVDFVGIQEIAKPLGFRFVFDFPNGSHLRKRAPWAVGEENSRIELCKSGFFGKQLCVLVWQLFSSV
jgi:hypothetical protein